MKMDMDCTILREKSSWVRRHGATILAWAALLGACMAMFGDVLFSASDRVLSYGHQDLAMQFIHWRQFGFSQMRSGHFPLWNPYVYCGVPFFGGFQSALLYPPNLIFLILPLRAAINWSIALHLFLGGLFMVLWARHRGLCPLACVFSGMLFMFCGAHFLHIYAGHLPNLCSMAWVPLLLLAIDGFSARRTAGWCLVGIFAVALQLLAGHPQYFFYTFIAAAIYCCFSVVRTQRRWQFLAGVILFYAAATSLGAMQVLAGLEAASESVRGRPTPFDFASSFAFPPENFLTLIAPGILGYMDHYWGRWQPWEMSLFVGVTGLVLAIYGAIRGDPDRRRGLVWMTLILLVLAMGRYTPVYGLLYDWLPLFGRFRGICKFIFPASLFIILLAGVGLDHLHRHRRLGVALPIALSACALLLLAFGAWWRLQAASGGTPAWWRQVVQWIFETRSIYVPVSRYTDPSTIHNAWVLASESLLISGGTFALLAGLLFLTRYSAKAVYAVALLGAVEVFGFALAARDTFHLEESQRQQAALLPANPGDYRFLSGAGVNCGMTLRRGGIWGSDAAIPRRYAELIAVTQGFSPDQADDTRIIRQLHPLFALLRMRDLVAVQNGQRVLRQFQGAMDRLNLIPNYRVLSNRDQILATLCQSSFDPRREVILEEPPYPPPSWWSAPAGAARIVEESTDWLIIEAELASPSILLVTDGYSAGWHAAALPGSSQQRYRVMPADYAFRAIPLSAGKHRIRMEYLPRSYVIGKWISIVSLGGYLAGLGWFLWRKWRVTHGKNNGSQAAPNASSGQHAR